MGNQYDRYEHESKDLCPICRYVRGSMACEHDDDPAEGE